MIRESRSAQEFGTGSKERYCPKENECRTLRSAEQNSLALEFVLDSAVNSSFLFRTAVIQPQEERIFFTTTKVKFCSGLCCPSLPQLLNTLLVGDKI